MFFNIFQCFSQYLFLATDNLILQVAIITEATIDLAGGNPLFAREITISAVDTFTDMISPEIITLLASEVLH